MQAYYVILFLMNENTDVIFDKHTQVKMLIMFVMSRLTQPIALEQLKELALCDDRISYFDVSECIPQLVCSNLLLKNDDKYTLTAKGAHHSEALETELLYSVRVKAEEAATKINSILSQDSLITTHSEVVDKGGWRTKLSLSDGVGEILNVELIAANKQQAIQLENGFRKKSQTIYHDIIHVITGEARK